MRIVSPNEIAITRLLRSPLHDSPLLSAETPVLALEARWQSGAGTESSSRLKSLPKEISMTHKCVVTLFNLEADQADILERARTSQYYLLVERKRKRYPKPVSPNRR